jgi:hypothetical protein
MRYRLAPVNLRVISSELVVSVETSKASDVARADPVGFELEPKVPV